jgi:hypothetical protein
VKENKIKAQLSRFNGYANSADSTHIHKKPESAGRKFNYKVIVVCMSVCLAVNDKT